MFKIQCNPSQRCKYMIEYNKVDLDIRNLFSIEIPKQKDKTGIGIYKRLYKISGLVSDLGLLHEEIQLNGKQSVSMSDLVELNQLKLGFKTTLMGITKYWLEIAQILELKLILSDIVENNKKENPELETEVYVVSLLDEVNRDILETNNIGFYIFLLLETLSDFCRCTKELSLVLSGEEVTCIPELFDSIHEADEVDLDNSEETEDMEVFWYAEKKFAFFLLLVKFIAIKFGIDYDAVLEEYFKNKK